MASTYLTYTQQSPSTVEGQKFTLSMWVKKCVNGQFQGLWGNTYSNTHRGYIYFTNSDYLAFYDSNGILVQTNRKFRDTNAFYHIVISADTTQGTASDRVKFYINGVQETSFSTANYPNQNDGMKLMNTTLTPNMGRYVEQGTSYYLRGVISHAHLTQGYTYDATPFGETDSTTGEWKIKTSVTGVTYGTNGFFILKDGNSLTDQSGNSNNFTVGGGTLTKTEDCPSNVFATMNPLSQKDPTVVYVNGNTKTFYNQTSTFAVYSTLAASSGKYYAECEIDAVGAASSVGVISVDTANLRQNSQDFIGEQTDSIGYLQNGEIKKANSNQQTGLTSFSNGTIVGIAMDLDNNTVQFYINGASTGNSVSLTADKFYYFGDAGHSDAGHLWNFGNGYFGTTAVSSAGTNASGNGIFEYDVPTGFTALSTKGLNL